MTAMVWDLVGGAAFLALVAGIAALLREDSRRRGDPR